MKNKWSSLRLVLVSAWLISSLACGSSQNQNGGNSSNIAVSNGNSKASVKNENSGANVSVNNTTSETKINNGDPKVFCNYLTDFVNSGEYKQEGANYKCSGKKTLNLSSGRSQELLFDAEGDAENIKNIKLSLVTQSKFKDNAEAEEALVKTCEQLWLKAFKMPLPEDIRNTILSDKGKATEKYKAFTVPTKAAFVRHITEAGRYGLSFDFDLPK